MNDEGNKKISIQPGVRNSVDEDTSIYVKATPMRGEKGKFKENQWSEYKLCGVCGGSNTMLIHHTSGGTSDGTVDVSERECLDCGNFTMYWYSDRV